MNYGICTYCKQHEYLTTSIIVHSKVIFNCSSRRSRRYGKVSLKTERMFELTEQGKPHEASSIRPLVPSPAKEPSFVEKSVDAEPVPAPVPSVEGQFCTSLCTLPLKACQ